MFQRLLRVLYALTVFGSAFLLFQLQPLAGKFLLPRFGGAPSVWTVCLLFFEAVLLVGYAYAHGLIRFVPSRAQAAIHLLVLLIAVGLLGGQRLLTGTPLLGGSFSPDPSSAPAPQVLYWLLRTVGFPYFALATTGPLIQAWFRRRLGGQVPYRLYALSNAGSLLGLLGYPLLTERYLTLTGQAVAWSVGFVLFAVGCGACALGSAAPSTEAESAATSGVPARGRQVGLWVALAAAPSAMLLASTNQLCQEVAAVPFLWVLPLGLYLLSFIICFDRPAWYRRGPWTALLVLSIVLVLCTPTAPMAVQIGSHALMLFGLCMVCHGELVRAQPPGEHLTLYYLAVAAGGAVGGLLVAVGAPAVFLGYGEFPLGIFLSCALILALFLRDPATVLRSGDPRAALVGVLGVGALAAGQLAGPELGLPRQAAAYLLAAVIAVAIYLLARRRYEVGPLRVAGPAWTGGAALIALAVLGHTLLGRVQREAAEGVARSRSFFGTLRVMEFSAGAPGDHLFALFHGNTLHGYEYTAAERRAEPTAYFGDGTGVSRALSSSPRRLRGEPMRVGIVGLGVGTLGAYARKGDLFRFYEIDPDVIRTARGEGGYFHFLADAAGTVEVVPGDGRLSLEREVGEGYDLLVLDAFSGHSIPMHLLTGEAFALYARSLRGPEAMIAVHITNHFLDLRPVVAALGARVGLSAVTVETAQVGESQWRSRWVILARDPALLHQGALSGVAQDLAVPADPAFDWTDGYGNLLAVMHASE